MVKFLRKVTDTMVGYFSIRQSKKMINVLVFNVKMLYGSRYISLWGEKPCVQLSVWLKLQ